MIGRVKDYYHLAKPGIIYGNLLTAAAGYLLAASDNLHWRSFSSMAMGTALIMGSACVVNNLYDHDIDALMQRTKARPSVNGSISFRNSVIYAVVLALVGLILLALFVNWLCVLVGLVGFIDYALIYTYFKRKTYHSTLIGSLAGATPIVGGYVAYSGRLSGAALVVGAMMLIWQMPHFYAISLYREDDYRRVKIPLLPIVKGHAVTTRTMVVYNIVFIGAIFSLYLYTQLSLYYLLVMGVASVAWLVYNLQGLRLTELKNWARRSFIFSLLMVVVMSVMVAIR